MSAPLVINLKDGSVWERRAVTGEGVALYALAGSCKCPEFVMATESELAALGIVGSADVLPMPVGPETSLPQGREWAELLARYGRALAPFCADPAAAAVAVMAVRDHEAEFLLRDAQRSQDRVTELELERHETNESLDDAVQELRARQSCPCPPADRLHQLGCPLDGVPVAAPCERPVNELTAVFMPVASLREDDATPQVQKLRSLLAGQRAELEDPHDSPLHQTYRLSHDLPEAGGR
jgi:hypothetical protein